MLLALLLLVLAIGGWAVDGARWALHGSTRPHRHGMIRSRGRRAHRRVAVRLLALDPARDRHAAARRDAPRRRAARRPPPRRYDYLYPAWQFAPDGKPLPVIRQLVTTARGAGMSDERLYEVLAGRTGISGDDRLADALRDGRDDYVLSVVRNSA